MIYSGLVSVTFRKLTPQAIVLLAAKAGIRGMEWGGDVHVPVGELTTAGEVRKMTLDAGLKVVSYGSYYRICNEQGPEENFEEVLETALALGAPNIRVWAGTRGSADADEGWWGAIVEHSRRIADVAEAAGVMISYEYHGGTLTDAHGSVQRLLHEVNHTNIRTYWQPPVDQSPSQRLKGLGEARPWLSHLHVFQWAGHERLPLSEGADDWGIYFEEASRESGERYAMLEFVKEDNPEQFMMDAHTLHTLLSKHSRNE